jgi:glycosyltransferase involved in cell wall biosynthesis
MISIVTITHNRRHFLPLAIENFNRIKNQEVEWIIVDDSYSSNQDLIPKQENIKYIFINFEQIKYILKQCYEKIRNKTFSLEIWYNYHLKTRTIPIGMKRNIANYYTKGDIIVYYDDDDYYPVESLNTRLEGLKDYDCVYCNKINCFNLSEETYFQKGGEQNNISEATMAYYKNKWVKHKFNNYDIEAEGKELVSKMNCNIINSDQVIISIYHSNNTSIASNLTQIEPSVKLDQETIEKIKSLKEETNCNQNQDLWILRDLFHYKKELKYLSIYPNENYNQLLDSYDWKGITINNVNQLKSCIKDVQNTYFPITNNVKYYKHINFLNISKRPDILEQLIEKYLFDVIIINYKNNKNFRESCKKILQPRGMILTKILNNEDCYLSQDFLLPYNFTR